MNRKRLLIFNVNWLGDVLFSTSAIRNLRHNFPESFIACIIPSRCYQILKGNPYLDEIIIYDEKDRHKGILAKMDFVRFLKAKRFDAVFLLHRSFSRALICRLAGIPQRIGYFTRKRAFLLTRNVPVPKENTRHRIDYYLNIIEASGVKVEDRYPEFFISDEDAEYADNFLKKEGLAKGSFLVAINPGGNWLPKRWPREYWAELSDRLIKELGARVIITGGPLDIKLAKRILSLMQEPPIIACGKFNLKQLGALCRKIDLFITADSGPMHIANAAGAKKIIALFGPTDPKITGPYPEKNIVILQKDVGCKRPCYVVNCKDNRCMKAVTAEDVLGKVKEIKDA
ncbi:MAG TPA: lipopolysaccharide heptosyltransferase II [Candidatus Omnitrophota bacterium]|nr:lipopolysaccharide heptosyltransferase II [Candidatus Omnitrophota bacterium]